MSDFELIAADVQWQGQFVRAGVERFRRQDGSETSRDKVWHAGAVGIIPLDEEHVWLTRQPREVVRAPASLEIPAGKLDVPGESPLETGKRELHEEIGREAGTWREVFAFYTSPGFTDERVWLFEATDLAETGPAELEEDERIEVVPWPLERLDEAIAQCEDSKTLIALLWLAARSASGLA